MISDRLIGAIFITMTVVWVANIGADILDLNDWHALESINGIYLTTLGIVLTHRARSTGGEHKK